MEPSQKAFLRLAVPNILTNLTVPLAGLIDLAILGHLEDITPLAGVALAGLIFDYLYWNFGFLRMSTTALTAKALGAKALSESAAVFGRGLLLASVLGGAILLSQIWIGDLGFAVLRGEAEVKAAGEAYYYARIWGAPATLANYVVAGWLLGRQHAGATLLISVLQNGLNVLLDFWLVYDLKMGAAGAGTATMISSVAALVLGLMLVRYFWRNHPPLTLGLLLQKKKIMEMIKFQTDLLIRTFCLITAFALFTNISAAFGAVVLAGNTLLLRLLNTAAYFIDGYAFALESLAGQFAGARNEPAIKRALRLALLWNGITVGGFLVVFNRSGALILSFLTHHQEVIQVGLDYFSFLSIALILSGFAYIYDGFFIGLARGRLLKWSMLLSTLLGFLPLALVALYLRRGDLLWWAMVVFMGFRALTLAPYSLHPLKAGRENVA